MTGDLVYHVPNGQLTAAVLHAGATTGSDQPPAGAQTFTQEGQKVWIIPSALLTAIING